MISNLNKESQKEKAIASTSTANLDPPTKKKSRHRKKKIPVPKDSKTGVAPIVKIPGSKVDASTNWKLLLSQKSSEVAERKKFFFRKGRKNQHLDLQKNTAMISSSPSNPDEVAEKFDALQTSDVKSHSSKTVLPLIKGLNTLGCFDYTHYGHLKTLILPEHKYLTEKTPTVAIDCEMVGVGPLKEDALARVSVVNEYGYCLYDKFVKPKAAVTDYRTEFSGVREEDLKQAEEFKIVITDIAELIKGCIIVGHSVQSDLDVLFLKHSKTKIRDTAPYYRKRFKKQKTPSLKTITKEYLNVDIQKGEHSSITDAQATMRLYQYCREEWEDSICQKYNLRPRRYWHAKEYRMGFKALGGVKTIPIVHQRKNK